MARLVLLGLTAMVASGCMRLHSIVPDGEGGAYMVSQKRFLGIGGQQTLIHCPVQGVTTSQCGIVLESVDVQYLGPVHYPPTRSEESEPDAMDLWGGIGSILEDLGDLEDEYYEEYPWSAGDTDLPPSGGQNAPCPDGAVRDVTSIPEGTTVTLIALHPDDAYSGSEHERDLPMTGIVDGDLHTNDGCWLGGGFAAENGTAFYFYKAAFRLD